MPPLLGSHCFHLAQPLNFSLPKKGKKAFLLHPSSSQHWATPPSLHSAFLSPSPCTQKGPAHQTWPRLEGGGHR